MRLGWCRGAGCARHGKLSSERQARPCTQRLRAVMQQNQQTNSQPGPTHPPPRPVKSMHSFFYFDPMDPEQVVEVQAAGAPSRDGLVAPRGLSRASSGTELATTNSQEESALARKAQLIQQELLAQLEDTRNKLQELQAQEAASREWRVRAQQASAELSALQRALVDKDAELESAYKRLESAAAERVALRKANLSLDEEARCLKAVMDEVRLLGASKDASAAAAAASAALGLGAGKQQQITTNGLGAPISNGSQ